MSSQINVCPLVSVVMPAYNSETRIACALESVITQDYPNIEIIVVNDASADATERTACRVLDGGGRPFVIINHEKNRGVSVARNTGLDAAKGEYVCFMDSDDLLEKRFISTLYGLITRYHCELSFCGLVDRFKDETPDILRPLKPGAPYVRSGEELTCLRAWNKIAPSVCATLFCRNFLLSAGVRFFEGCSAGEDVEFQLKIFCRAERIAFTPECLYVYVHHAGMGSIRDNDTREKKIHRYRDNTGAHLRTAAYLSEHAPSERIKRLADGFLLPQALIRRFTLCAKTGDRAGFEALLSDKSTRKTLSASKRFFFQKPEVYLKAFVLLHFPALYYRLRRA